MQNQSNLAVAPIYGSRTLINTVNLNSIPQIGGVAELLTPYGPIGSASVNNCFEVFTAGTSGGTQGSKIEEIIVTGLSNITFTGLVALVIGTSATLLVPGSYPAIFDYVALRAISTGPWFRSLSSDFGGGSSYYPNLWIPDGLSIWAALLPGSGNNGGLIQVTVLGADF